MKSAVALLASLACLSLVSPAFACPDEDSSTTSCSQDTSKGITKSRVAEQLPNLLRMENLPGAAAPRLVIQPMELDGNAHTEEAFVTVFSPEVCGAAMLCPTLTVMRRGCSMWSVGHGVGLTVMPSRTRGWSDLGEMTPSFIPLYWPIARTLRWNGHRYVR